ncbi:MAG: hypothetical protein ACOYD4_07015 [Solirubrobacterales bacterium]
MRGTVARRLAAVCAALALALVGAAPVLAAPVVDGTFKVKGVETNNKIVAGPDGNMWVTLAGMTNNVARITLGGEVKEFELGLSGTSGIAVGPEGNLWVTSTEAVTSFSATDPVGTKKSTAITAIKDDSPIVAGPDGNMWVATKGVVLKFVPANPAGKTEFAVTELSPKDIDVVGSSLAISDSSAKNRIETVTTAGVLGQFSIPGASQGLAAGPGGQLGFSVPGANPEQVGLVTLPGAPVFGELGGDPFGVALGSDQAYWVAQFTPGGLTRMTTAGVKTFLPGLPKESPRQIAAGPDNTMWVTLVKNEAEGVARISGLEPPQPLITTVAAPQTKIGKGPKKVVKTTRKRVEVSFRFSSTTPGATFQCALTKVVKAKKGKKAPQPKFRGCKSPRSYSVSPGKYRFAVRAVNAGVVDPSAATRSFRVIRVHQRAHKR